MSTEKRIANAIRALTMDAIQQAKSGHPGAPMGMADIAEALWTDILKHNPANPGWINRDRFVLSNGHGSMLLYSLLHLTGYDLPMDEIRRFRQLGSKTAGHPEYKETPGVETTTGPLGQGFANAVGMAVAEQILAARFNRPDHNVVDHFTYVFAGDGCLMEGVSHEAASLAGTLQLSKLICVYDDNGISIDGSTDGWFTEDTASRFSAYHWHVIDQVDGHDREAVKEAILAAKQDDRPSIICCQTKIGFGSPNKEGTASSHGSPLGEDEIVLTREALGWTDAPFEIPEDVYSAWDCRQKGADSENTWQQQFAEYKAFYPELAAELERTSSRELPVNWEEEMAALARAFQNEGKSVASRSASGEVIAKIASLLPELTGGSADLSGSNCTIWPEASPMAADSADANYISYGVREFGMTAIGNGIALHGGLRPFAGTFLIFMEYARNAARMAALMGVPNILVYTHDSIGQGEDGPTHQPVEQLANLRGTPNMSVWRPCDAVETVCAWKCAIENNGGPTALVFSRQGLPTLDRTDKQMADIARGAYVVFETDDKPEHLIIATGSEVSLAIEGARQLADEGISVRVVSMPSADVFEAQDASYRESVIPSDVRKRLAIEAGHVDYWRKWVGLDGDVIGMTSFGASAPGADLFSHFGFTADRVVEAVKGLD
ncbi:MAG: transketolase [Gammaproteobacteria bacterium]|jgi:transketolase|nr:transketolase [Gammaproteobacteria bacterium]MBT4494076.1 transketolase [Gammaproteobacteria bacterium]MBT7370292.1 transketolase [Gammaproteobacteria bacterium]